MKKVVGSLLVATSLFATVNGVFAEEIKTSNGQEVQQNVNTRTYEQMREDYYAFLVKHKIPVEPLIPNYTGNYTMAYMSISGGYTAEGSWVDGVFKYTGDTIYMLGIRGHRPYTIKEQERIKKFIEKKFDSKIKWTEASTQSDGKGWFRVGFNLNNDPLKYADKVQ
ncbi:hypothetical protein [Bacillus sp. AFS031507]|uniref:hypothetical protein n=1 Tax=Bacillus sp. AFS031507 TaxID=2033496 RepID=UPI000BFE69A2|nr:hypothetical protein [Bacillus sp. AFS031507]PGY11119.1 hypothetical protein COE25_11395 [Bacillus sp. AFS031507]